MPGPEGSPEKLGVAVVAEAEGALATAAVERVAAEQVTATSQTDAEVKMVPLPDTRVERVVAGIVGVFERLPLISTILVPYSGRTIDGANGKHHEINNVRGGILRMIT